LIKNNLLINSGKHPDLEYTQLEPLFSCVLTEAGTALGKTPIFLLIANLIQVFDF
jgi:hypothetical protein